VRDATALAYDAPGRSPAVPRPPMEPAADE
jgi:hypothetical protein